MSTLENSWRCEKHFLTWDMGTPCSQCYDELVKDYADLCKVSDRWRTLFFETEAKLYECDFQDATKSDKDLIELLRAENKRLKEHLGMQTAINFSEKPRGEGVWTMLLLAR